jgi:hypothetical protein
MALVPGLPAPLPPWLRVLIRLGEAGAFYLISSLVDHAVEETDRSKLEWRRLVIAMQRATPVGSEEDYAHMTFDLVNITGGQIDQTWTDTDFTTCETFYDEWFNAFKASIDNGHTVVAYRWYRMRFRQIMTDTHRFEDTGPPVRVQTKTIAGTDAATVLPYQCAMSVTEKTGVPKHWGRFYIPGLTTSSIVAASGRWSPTVQTAVANATAELYDDLQGAQFYPVVPLTQVNKVLRGALLTVNQVVVDDIPDVIRRRRPRQALVRTAGVPAA